MESVLQVLDGTGGPGENIVTEMALENVSIDGDDKAVFGVAFGKFGATQNQLVKMVDTQSLSIARCRFGYLVGGADVGIETDSAGYSNTNTVIEECPDGAVFVDTGNGAAISFTSPTWNGNGYNPTTDTYNPSGEGFNLKIIGGECNLFGGTCAGAGATQAATASVIASSADVRVNGWWSDSHGIWLQETGGSSSSIYINGLRHNEGSMTPGNTPISIKHVCKMNITGSLLYGVIESTEGASGSITTVGVNFVEDGAAGTNATAYTGTLITNQKGLVSINNRGNRAQIVIGGGDRDIEHIGHFTPQRLSIGARNENPTPACIEQVLGNIGDAGYTVYHEQSKGSMSIYVNCYKDDNSNNIKPILTTKDSHVFVIGGGTFSLYDMYRYKFTTDKAVEFSLFEKSFQILQAASDSLLGEVVMVPPKLSADPTFNSGDYWEGGIYYNTTSKKLKVNTGGLTWDELNPTP
jgi:hypothetical protein